MMKYMCAVLACLCCWSAVAAMDPTDEGAFYDYRSWSYTADESGYELTFTAKKTITGRCGDKYSYVSVWENAFVRVDDIKVTVLDADGKKIYSRKKKDFLKICGYARYAVYSDVCHYRLDVSAAHYPYSIEYEYTVSCNTLFFLTGNVIQAAVPTNRVTYEISAKPEVSFDYRCKGFAALPEVNDTGNGRVVHRWRLENIPKYDPDDYVPAELQPEQAIRIRCDRIEIDSHVLNPQSWENIGAWYHTLAEDRYACPREFIPPPSELPVRDRVKALYDEIIRDVRYVSVSIGIGGWQPHAAELTAERNYGDCKDMSTLLIARLRTIGVTAYPCLILTRDEGITDSTFPDNRFNHVITAAVIDDDTLWMDATCSKCRFGELPSNDEDTFVLMVTDDGGRLVRTPASTGIDNSLVRTTAIHLDEHGVYRFSTELSPTGNRDGWMKNVLSGVSRDDEREFVEGLFPGTGTAFEIDDYAVSHVADVYEPTSIVASGTALRPADKIGSKMYVPLLPFCALSGLEQVDLTDRIYPLNLFYPRLVKDSITLTWDAALAIDSVELPAAADMEFPFGEIELRCEADDSSVTVVFAKTRTQYSVSAEQFPEFLRYREALSEIYKRFVKLYTR